MFAQMGNRALPRAACRAAPRRQAARAVAPAAALPLHRTELRRRVTVSAKKPKAAEPEPVPEPEDEEYDDDEGIFSCTLVVSGEAVQSAPSAEICARIAKVCKDACAGLLPSEAELSEAGWEDEQAVVVLGPEDGEELELELDEVTPPIFVEFLFMTEEKCETGLEKALIALKAAGFEAELFEDDDEDGDEWDEDDDEGVDVEVGR